jgi:hypothetical protein
VALPLCYAFDDDDDPLIQDPRKPYISGSVKDPRGMSQPGPRALRHLQWGDFCMKGENVDFSHFSGRNSLNLSPRL